MQSAVETEPVAMGTTVTASPTSASWVVQELPTVGWVVKEMPLEELPAENSTITASDLPGYMGGNYPPLGTGLTGLQGEWTYPLRHSAHPDEFHEAPSTAPPRLLMPVQAHGPFDAFIMFAPGLDKLGRNTALRAASVSAMLHARGVAVCQQNLLTSVVSQKLATSSDEGQLMAQAAQSSACAVLLLTRRFLDRVESGVFGDGCVAAFTLATRLSCVIIVALEPELLHSENWGWNRVFARFSGRVVVDMSMDEAAVEWDEAVDHLAWLLCPGNAPEGWVPAPLLPPERPEPVPEEALLDDRRYHCFISHNWGLDRSKRDNHQRVLQIAQALKRNGLDVFLEEWELHRYNSYDEAIVDGMRRSSVAVICLTKSYIDRIEKAGVSDDCVAQFNLAKRAPNIILVVLEPELRNPLKWGWNRVFAHLAGKLLLDLSSTGGSGLKVLWSPSAQRWQSGIDLLELRVRESASGSKHRTQRPVPFLPHRGTFATVAACWLVSSSLGLAASIGQCVTGASSFPFQVLWIVSCGIWALGFLLRLLWHLLKARTPPEFNLNSLKLPMHCVGADFLRSAGWLVMMIPAIFFLCSLEEHVWIGLIGAYCFCVGSCVAALDSLSPPKAPDAPERWRPRGLLARLLGWGVPGQCYTCMASGALVAYFHLRLQVPIGASTCGTGIGGSALLCVAAADALLWLQMTQSRLRTHFEELESSKSSSSVLTLPAFSRSAAVAPEPVPEAMESV